ncbi:MAG: Gfo/Idh/MocA family protein [Armatimonadota bacterium]|jgi:predicted dehydrogenase
MGSDVPNIVVVGFGYWGPNMARNFAHIGSANLTGICDGNPLMLEKAKIAHPGVKLYDSYDEVLRDDSVDAVVIATPVSTHAPLALKALEADKHILVEKPLAGNYHDALSVVEAAEKSGKVLLVDHTFCYQGAIRKIKELIDSHQLGDLYYFDSVRVNLGLIQRDVSVLWDLAVHDLSIIGYWIKEEPVAVSCTGSSHFEGKPEDVAYLTLFYSGGFIAHVHVNWLSPVKLRTTLLGGEKKMIVFDDLDPVEKIKVYDRGVVVEDNPVGDNLAPLAYRRTGDIWMPQFDMTEAIKVEAEHFVNCIRGKESPITGGKDALRIVKILEAAEKSLRLKGEPVNLEGDR